MFLFQIQRYGMWKEQVKSQLCRLERWQQQIISEDAIILCNIEFCALNTGD